MTDTTLPTADDVRKRLDYDPATGVFVWRYCDASPREWNTRWAGKVAGTDHGAGYREITIDYMRCLSHRIAWLVTTGDWPTAEIDHINGNRADNRIANLRDVTNAENRRNMAMRSDNTSGNVGIRWHKQVGKWQSRIYVKGREIHLGLFTDLADAIAARKAAEILYGFHSNHGRVAQMAKTG
jgi:hypothetical protein